MCCMACRHRQFHSLFVWFFFCCVQLDIRPLIARFSRRRRRRLLLLHFALDYWLHGFFSALISLSQRLPHHLQRQQRRQRIQAIFIYITHWACMHMHTHTHMHLLTYIQWLICIPYIHYTFAICVSECNCVHCIYIIYIFVVYLE